MIRILEWITEMAARLSRLFSRKAKQDRRRIPRKAHNCQKEYSRDEEEEQQSNIYPLW